MKERLAGAAAALALLGIVGALFWVNMPRVPAAVYEAAESEPAPEPEPEPEPEPVEAEFSFEEVTLCVGEELEIAKEDERISFISDAEKTAVMEGNVVKAVGTGSAVIRAAEGSEDNMCRVTVLAAPKKLSLSHHEMTLFVGESAELVCDSDPTGVEPVDFTAGGEVSFDQKEMTLSIEGVKAGSTVLAAETYNGLKAECSITVLEKPEKTELADFGVIAQWPELPTGCEVTALTMAMRYLGFDLEKCELADNYLPMSWDFLADVRYTFLGSPRDSQSAGCYAPCIVTTAESYLKDKKYDDEWEVLNLTDSEPAALYDYVAKGTPVLVWVTSSMREPYVNYYCRGEDGETVPWMFPEHCAVLIGYDFEEGTVQIADSEVGYIRTVGIETFEKIYGMMLSQAVVVVKK